MLYLLIALSTICYLAFGFYLGIVRERLWAWIDGDGMGLAGWGRSACVVFCFPVTTYWMPSEPLTLLAELGGGWAYWLVIAFVWPLTIAWSLTAVALWLCAFCIAGISAVIDLVSRWACGLVSLAFTLLFKPISERIAARFHG